MGHPRYSTDEIVARGKEIYEKQLKSKLEPQNFGKFLVIDIDTGSCFRSASAGWNVAAKGFSYHD